MLDIVKTEAVLVERYDFYGTIHRGLRKAQMELLARIGSLDAANNLAVAILIDDIRKQIVLGRFHLVDENEHVHSALELRRPGASAGLVLDHAEHERCFEELEEILAEIEERPPIFRKPTVRELYLRYSRFIADDFAHMLEEETAIQPMLHDLFSDEELKAIEGRIIASIPPDVMLDFIRIMIPAVDPEVRADMVRGMRASMPPDPFRTIMRDVIKPVLNDFDWRRLNDGLNRAA